MKSSFLILSAAVYCQMASPAAASRTLVPDAPGNSQAYWCTWATQKNSLPSARAKTAEQAFDGDQGAVEARANLNEQVVFGPGGWAETGFPRVRSDLYLLLDDGWDVAYGVDAGKHREKFGAVEPDPQRFPHCTGQPAERLRCLNERAKRAGWRGLGLWIAAQAVGERKDRLLPQEQYWRERLRWSHEAGIAYWKVDWGVHCNNLEWRRFLTSWAREEAPGLVVEHAIMGGPLNDIPPPWGGRGDWTGRFASSDGRLQFGRALLDFSDVVRTYDIADHLASAITVDRVAQLLVVAAPLVAGNFALLNAEDEVYLAAALGCTIGVMRHPSWQEEDAGRYDPMERRKRLDEVTRAVRWQRIAGPVGAGQTSVALSAERLTDRWLFQPGEHWAGNIIGKEIAQSAPAVVARGMELPLVRSTGSVPFVVASRHPNGAVAVATLERPNGGKIIIHRAHVTIRVPAGTTRVGVFGHYASLTLRFEGVAPARVWAQDLAGDRAADISRELEMGKQELVLPGAAIDRFGCEAATAGDLSPPALVLALD